MELYKQDCFIPIYITFTYDKLKTLKIPINPEVLKKVAEGGKKINDALDAKIQQLENDITTM